MGINITFHQDPELSHINLRKQGEEGLEEIAVDLKIIGLAKIGPKAELIQTLLGCDAEFALAFWDRRPMQERVVGPNDDGPEPSFLGVTKILSTAEFRDNHTACIAGLELRPDRIKKFSIKPRAGFLVDLEFQVSVSAIDNRELQILTESLRDPVPCEITADPDLFDEEAA